MESTTEGGEVSILSTESSRGGSGVRKRIVDQVPGSYGKERDGTSY